MIDRNLRHEQLDERIVELMAASGWLPSFVLYFLHRQGPMAVGDLNRHLNLHAEQLQIIIARLVGLNLLTLLGDKLSLTGTGEKALALLDPPEQSQKSTR